MNNARCWRCCTARTPTYSCSTCRGAAHGCGPASLENELSEVKLGLDLDALVRKTRYLVGALSESEAIDSTAVAPAVEEAQEDARNDSRDESLSERGFRQSSSTMKLASRRWQSASHVGRELERTPTPTRTDCARPRATSRLRSTQPSSRSGSVGFPRRCEVRPRPSPQIPLEHRTARSN